MRSITRRSVLARPRFLGLLASAGVALAIAAGCADTAERPPPSTAVDPAEQKRIDSSRKKIDEAGLAVDQKRYSEARKLLAEARAIGVESHRFEISELLEKLNKREAKLWANEIYDRLEQKECEEAFKELNAQMKELQSEGFAHEVRKLIQKQALACVNTKVDALTQGTKFAEARAFVDAEATKAALGDAIWNKVSTELGVTITEAIAGKLAADLRAKQWVEAVDKLDAAVKKGDATEPQRRAIMGRIRAAAGPELTADAAKATGSKDAATHLKDIEAIITRLGWQAMPPDAAALAPDKALPEDLAQRHRGLATWVEAQRLKMKPSRKPEKRWSHGKIAVLPATSAAGASKRDISPSTEVWVLGKTKDLALVTDADPGSDPLTTAIVRAIGWVPVARLAPKATIDWIPPNDQLKGERVWGPLRAKQATLELGIVSDVKGAEILVKRLADDAIIKVTRGQLRNGRLAKGTKVLAYCQKQNDIATIYELLPGGRVARIQCEGGRQKEESLASLRTKAELLPPGK